MILSAEKIFEFLTWRIIKKRTNFLFVENILEHRATHISMYIFLNNSPVSNLRAMNVWPVEQEESLVPF